jgi:putative ubiquitin-RnfH superfamily antitoxin RatB of RatAB toxin-antitoxin module
MASAKPILRVEVAYATQEEQVVVPLEMEPGTTLEGAIRHSGLLRRFKEIDLAKNQVGVFGKLGRLNSSLREGDRVEIYRPLIADPKQVRRQRATAGKTTKKGGNRSSTKSD